MREVEDVVDEETQELGGSVLLLRILLAFREKFLKLLLESGRNVLVLCFGENKLQLFCFSLKVLSQIDDWIKWVSHFMRHCRIYQLLELIFLPHFLEHNVLRYILYLNDDLLYIVLCIMLHQDLKEVIFLCIFCCIWFYYQVSLSNIIIQISKFEYFLLNSV